MASNSFTLKALASAILLFKAQATHGDFESTDLNYQVRNSADIDMTNKNDNWEDWDGWDTDTNTDPDNTNPETETDPTTNPDNKNDTSDNNNKNKDKDKNTDDNTDDDKEGWNFCYYESDCFTADLGADQAYFCDQAYCYGLAEDEIWWMCDNK